ncbi:MAG: SGNH/GDSL hydrolase family protein [bacterium]|nr:SGNH/GDSL hydrolase family protein [bacterium]
MHEFVFASVFILGTLSVVAWGQPEAEPTNADEAAKAKAAAVQELEAKYQAWVETLEPEARAWEGVLQENLGDFYLPLHKGNKVAGKSNAWDYVVDDPKLPRVLLIGDSISRGYTLPVRNALEGKANVHRAPANCGPTAMGLEKIDLWLGDGAWDVIHFNFGIHDRNTPVADYIGRLEQLVVRMKKTGATLVWASSTPIPDIPEQNYAAASIVRLNQAAENIMQGHGIGMDDLFSAVTPHLGELQNDQDVHFKGEGYDFLGRHVAASIEAALK